jgi:hypothetical protein
MLKREPASGRRTTGLLHWSLVAAVSVLTAGCQERNGLSGATLRPVKGKVILADGKPLKSGSVVFVATTSTVSATAPIEDDGSFAFKGGGLPEGEYHVRIEAPAEKAVGGKPTGNVPFASMYLDEDASKLTANVTADETKNNFEFKLEAKDPLPSAGSGRGRGGR